MRTKSTIVPVTVIICLLWYLYGVRGNAEEVESTGRSAIVWMVRRWMWARSDFSHAWLIPIVSCAVIWLKRRELSEAPKNVNWMGLAGIVASLALHWIGIRAQLTRISLVSLIGLLWSIPFYLYGWRVARLLIFPCAYLFFCIPLSFLNNLTVPLRILASTVSAHLLNGLGIPAMQTGTVIRSLDPNGFHFGVADPCSGLRSLIAMTALTAAYAYFAQKTLLRKWLLFLAAVPLAIIGNISRIVIVALIAEGFGMKFAMGVYEQFSGLLIFSVAVLLMIGLGQLLNVNYADKFRKWQQQATNIIS